MEGNNEAMKMLDLMVSPAFCVEDGVITYANPAARQRTVTADTKVHDLIAIGKEEYDALSDGCLYLSLTISSQSCGASVTRMDGFDVFVLEQDADQCELQAMALAARELRSPLSSIMTVADRLFPMISTGEDPAAQEQVSRINRGLFQMLRVISNMSDAARYASETDTCQRLHDISAVMDEIFRTAQERIRHTQITLRFTNLQESVFSLADEEKLERAVYNILSNAAKFTPKGGTIDARLYRRGEKLYLAVQDSGAGIPSELRGNVFSRYQRQPGVEDGRFGIGLGMVLIRSAATAHGGTVLVDFPENGGTRITMSMAIRRNPSGIVRSPILQVDYAGERDHSLIELSDSLPCSLYEKEKIN